RRASGSAVAPCTITLISTVKAMTATAGPATRWPSSSSASNAKTTDARPRGPDQPTNAVAARPNRAPASAAATGAIRITVRLSTAYTTVCQITLSSAGTTAITPNASQTSSDTRAPVSSTNGDKAIAVQRHRADIGAERQPQDRRAREIALGPPTAARHLHQEASRAADSHADKHAKRQLGDGSARPRAGRSPLPPRRPARPAWRSRR